MKFVNVLVPVILLLFVSALVAQETAKPTTVKQTKVDVLKNKPPQVMPCAATQTCPDGQYCSMYAGKKYCTEQAIPPTCLPPTEPNCGLTGECPEKFHCSRFESLEYCCITAPMGSN